MQFWQIIFDQAINHGNFSFFILVVGVIQVWLMAAKKRPEKKIRKGDKRKWD